MGAMAPAVPAIPNASCKPFPVRTRRLRSGQVVVPLAFTVRAVSNLIHFLNLRRLAHRPPPGKSARGILRGQHCGL